MSIYTDYWKGPAGVTDNACRTDYLKVVQRRSQKQREATRGTYRKQYLSNTEIA